MKKVLIGLGVVAGLAVATVGGGFVWGKSALNTKLAEVWDVHDHAVPVPWPLSEEEVATLRAEKLAELEAAGTPTEDEAGEPVDVLADVDLAALGLERSIARGEHLVQTRYFCVECHGKDLSGGVMIDAPPMGSLLGRNLTTGKGSVTLEYTPADWDKIVRHGVKKDGTGAVMPSEDFVGMSDQELSDIISYIGTFAAVDNDVPPPTFGPVFTMLIATDQVKLSAATLAGEADHVALPPESAETVEFGGHLAKTCTGCHRADFSGGPILAGDPSWPPSSNLTTGEGGVGGDYTFESFDTMMRTGVKPNGEATLSPMDLIPPYAEHYTETEMKALWAFVQSLEAKPTGI